MEFNVGKKGSSEKIPCSFFEKVVVLNRVAVDQPWKFAKCCCRGIEQIHW